MTIHALNVRPIPTIPAPVPWTCTVFNTWDTLLPLKSVWDAFVRQVGGDIYFSFDWCRLWWRHYGRDRALRIFVFRAGPTWAGVVPMFLERVRLGPVSLRIAKLVGADFAMALCNPPVRRSAAPRVFADLLADLLDRQACDAVHIGPLAGTYPSTEDLIRVCRDRSDKVRIARDTIPAPHTVVPLPATFEEYLHSIDRQQRADYRRHLNQLTRTFRIKTDVIRDPDAADLEFVHFRDLHTRQWQAEGKLGHFGDWPGAEAFNRDVLRAQAVEGRLRLTCLIADGDVVSYQLCYRFGDTWFWRLPARRVGGPWNRYGLGRIGLIKMIEAAISEGASAIEAGIGRYEYKCRLGAREYPLRSILIAANRPSSRLRAELFCRLADALHLLYYRLWFHRLAPRLPLPRRPLWRTWIRSRL